jgi:hypothetical protein
VAPVAPCSAVFAAAEKSAAPRLPFFTWTPVTEFLVSLDPATLPFLMSLPVSEPSSTLDPEIFAAA